MVFSDLLLTFLSFWTLVHVIFRLLLQQNPLHATHQNLSRITNNSLSLPISNPNLPFRKPPAITLSYFCLRYKTTKFNTFFESLAKKAPKFWKIWFDVGVFVGISAMIIGICVMILAGWKLLLGMIGSFEFSIQNHDINDNTSLQPKFVKRSGEINHHVEKNNEDHQIFIPVIPGVTLPTSHLIYYLIALFICGIIHEAGHAIAAYCESVPIDYAGIFLYFFYPGAFVSFSELHFNKCSFRKKLRILCAGVWHNVVIFLFGMLILNSGIVTLLMSLTGYRSVEGTGVSVISVESSDLTGILYPSTLITKLDDYELNEASLDKWNKFLLKNYELTKGDYGFCASEKDITPALDCCDITAIHPYGNSEDKEISCFQRSDQNNSHYKELSCLHARPILVNINEQRCRKDLDCDNPSPMCVLPYTPVGFPVPVRIYFKHPSWIANQKENKEQVLLWLGDLENLWEIVQVSTFQPRWSWVPLWIPFAVEIIIRYTVSFSLALCILNILPAFQLDGYHALTTILTRLYGVDDGMSTAISISKRNRQRKKVENGIVYGVTGLVGWVVFGTLVSGVFFEGH
ncbi:hypothetical protein RclHR1_01960026 [Rhizophagus clarus]|uniref:Endopeptidase S2P n=1 Tax=Rhizophagus clarus TaxID=94130 RepID=A0A2Z6RI56_9GLOM|nr:hypothetical protein RclHR1_01960026 [Rhizophagus clarus]